MYHGCSPKSSGSVVVILSKSSELLEILDHPVSKTGPSGFAESDSRKQISALYISQKLDHPVHQTGTSIFSRIYSFPGFDQKPHACYVRSFATVL
jgi:hypothetical protein